MDLFSAFEEWKPIDNVIQTPEDFISKIYQPLRQSTKNLVIGVDTETTDIHVPARFHDIDLLGISLSFDGQDYYIPIGHITNGPQLPIEKIMPLLNQVLFNRSNFTKVAHNLKFDMAMLQKYGAVFAPPYYCTQIMSWLVDENRGKGEYRLKFLSEHELGVKMREFHEVNKGNLIDARLDDVGDYARADARQCLALYTHFRDFIEDELLEDALELEMSVLPVVVDMEVEGMTIDFEELQILAKQVTEEVNMLEKRVFDIVGYPFNVDSSDQLRKILFKELKLKATTLTNTGKPSTDEKALKMLLGQHPLIETLLEYRTFRKLQSTYTEGFSKRCVGDKIYGEFNQMGTETGRFSSSGPNLQNLPRDSERIKFRKIFSTPPGYVMIDADYSQLELRLIAHFAQDPNLLKGFREGIDGHTSTAATMNEVPYDEVTKEMRQIAKNINFGLAYGAGVKKLAMLLGRDVEFAQAMWDLYRSKYEGIFKWRESVIKECYKDMYIRTLIGRKRRLWEIHSSDKGEQGHAEREAVNCVIQGTAADVAKNAMYLIKKKFGNTELKIISQVHDEIIMLCPEDIVDDVLPELKHEMETPFSDTLLVPLVAEPGTGPNWTEAKV